MPANQIDYGGDRFLNSYRKSDILKILTKTVGILIAVFSLTFFGACGFFNGSNSGTTEDEVVISQSEAEIKVGESVTLSAVSSEKREIKWSSSDEEIAQVDNGVVTGLKAGVVSITASDGKKMASCEVTVVNLPPAVTIEISNSRAEIEEGKSITLTATVSNGSDVSWSSSDETVETVSENGLVTAIKAGTANITASGGGVSAKCVVTVVPKGTDVPSVTIKLSQTKAEIKAGASITLTATVSDGSDVIWNSSDKNIASVDRNGKVTGIKAGTADITASCGNVKAVCKVTVTAVTEPDPDTPVNPDRKLVWSDEFNGDALDMSKWGYQTGTQDHYGDSWGPSDWGNGEQQYYTDGANVKVTDGALQIIAKRENMGNKGFTSSRITTRDKFSRTFGYIEAKIKTPAIEGMWPAFWMLPQPPNPSSSLTDYGGWAANGEIDIMEAKGRLLNKVDTTIHFGGEWPNNTYLSHETTLNSNTDEWHTYAVDWRAEYIAWIVDGKEVYKLDNSKYWSSASSAASAPFDKPFYILLNLAVGGMYDGHRNPPADFVSASMYIDYVRVYE